MKKNSDTTTYLLILIIILVLAFLLVSGAGKTIINNYFGQGQSSVQTPDQVQDHAGYDAAITISNSFVCQGESIMVSLATNINNGKCALFAKPSIGDWKYLTTIDLNAYGDYSTSVVVNLPLGSYVGTGVCYDNETNAKKTNSVILNVIDCSNNGGNNGGSNGGSNDSGSQGAMACSAVWNPTLATCSAASCPNTGEQCFYYPASIVSDADCGCAVPTCDLLCKKSSYSSGICKETAMVDGTPIRSPCAYIGTQLPSGSAYCGASQYGFGNKACCCS